MEQKETYNSLYEYISAKAKPFLKDGDEMDFTIPEDFKDNDSNGIPFADGAYDGIAVYHMGSPELSNETRELMINAQKIASTGDKEAAERAFTELGKSQRAIHVIDPLQDYIIEHKDEIPANRLYEFAVYAITHSCDIECVKFGLAILELLVVDENEELKDVITMLGFSEEFTMFALFVMRRWSDGNERIFRLARKTRGWGRIHAIRELEADDDKKRKWLLRNGVHNTVMPSYSALTCWNKSGAAELLFGDEPLSDEDFRGIRDIIVGLLDEGPVSGISELENAADVLSEFLKKTSRRLLDTDDLNALLEIKKYAEDNAELNRLCDEILNTDSVRGLVAAAVKNGEAVDLAITLGIDCREDIMALLESDIEKNAHLCRYVTDDAFRPRVIEIFREKLPLKDLIAEPSDELRFGGSELNLLYLVQMLDNYPLEGTDLVEISLQCAPPQNRNMALRVLKSWVESKGVPLRELLPDTYELLCRLRAGEVNKSAAKSMDELIF